MANNELTGCLVWFVFAILAGPFTLLMFHLGSILAVPLVALAAAVIYLKATGQQNPGPRKMSF